MKRVLISASRGFKSSVKKVAILALLVTLVVPMFSFTEVSKPEVTEQVQFNRCMAHVSSTHCPAEAEPGSEYCKAHQGMGDEVAISFQAWLN